MLVDARHQAVTANGEPSQHVVDDLGAVEGRAADASSRVTGAQTRALESTDGVGVLSDQSYSPLTTPQPTRKPGPR